MSSTTHPHLLGFWICVALVVGNSIGSGVFLVPASLAPFGLNSVLAWGITACGAILLAIVFARLSRAYPAAGGPYAYVHLAFGPFIAFIVAWGYWISIWVGIAAIATGAVSYLSPLLPWIASVPGASAAVTLLFLWLLTCILACSTVLLLVPATTLAKSNAPFVDLVTQYWGSNAGKLLAVFAAISGFGALNGWILLQAELPHAMAKGGVFPRLFARESPRRTPSFALFFSSGLVTLLILMNYQKSMVSIFTFMILLSTTSCLVLYVFCSLALLRLQWTGQLNSSQMGVPRRGTVLMAIVGVIAAAYCLWAIVGAGAEAVGWGAVLLALGAPLYFFVRKNP